MQSVKTEKEARNEKLENGLNKAKKKQRLEPRLELGKSLWSQQKKEFPKLIQLLNYFDSFYGSSRFDWETRCNKAVEQTALLIENIVHCWVARERSKRFGFPTSVSNFYGHNKKFFDTKSLPRLHLHHHRRRSGFSHVFQNLSAAMKKRERTFWC
jgi:hypothetical protein